MVREQLASRGIDDAATLAAMGLVPREAFVPAAQHVHAYADRALSIGRGQTISQPYMVARMTASLRLSERGWPWGEERPIVLDVGTGSGYQAAVLAQIGARVVSIERDPELADEARARLASLGYAIDVRVGDGSLGYEPLAPYAGIVVAAAAPQVPSPLVDQLAQGARLVVPVGSRSTQHLMIVRREGDTTRTDVADACVFVPLVGSHGHPG
ncbi:MAG TPA: protein-L-isoaspartate(D-aspartate) O-methyltransferase [Candidatus Limnocylindrales bacterium]|nr:protein-L-isoaspartate(D-aspartate) O-methyltransferase [Candidatus Limnocylindrales bacterium]